MVAGPLIPFSSSPFTFSNHRLPPLHTHTHTHRRERYWPHNYGTLILSVWSRSHLICFCMFSLPAHLFSPIPPSLLRSHCERPTLVTFCAEKNAHK